MTEEEFNAQRSPAINATGGPMSGTLAERQAKAMAEGTLEDRDAKRAERLKADADRLERQRMERLGLLPAAGEPVGKAFEPGAPEVAPMPGDALRASPADRRVPRLDPRDPPFANMAKMAKGEQIGTASVAAPTVPDRLESAAAIYRANQPIYGDNYKRFGPILSILMANTKVDITNPTDCARLGIFVQMVGKMTRYAENFARGGHADSLDDISVYAMMLRELDAEASEE